MDFKLMVKSENLWVSNEEMQNIPSAIQKEYFYLKDSIQKDDICGALFRLKDIYEISMKIPAIMAIISISSFIEEDNEFIRKTHEQLIQEHNDFIQEKIRENTGKSDEFEKYSQILSRLLRAPMTIGTWRELVDIIVEHANVFELDYNLVRILSRTIELQRVKPRKGKGETGRYQDVGNWRNKTLGHGTLCINTEDYWEQVFDLVKGLYIYFSADAKGESLDNLYENIYITQAENDANEYALHIGNKRYVISEYIYHFDDEYYFFDSYYSGQKYTEITNYFSAPKRLKNNSYYQRLDSLLNATNKSRKKIRGRQITNSIDREMYACLNSIPDYERPTFVINEIKKFINENKKGVFYIQMERGMGKSTLAHGLDGRYQKGILQKDLNAVVRVYHISDMQLREEERVRDFFTSLNTNLISFEGGRLEVDEEEYLDEDGNDLRQLIRSENKDAQIAFAKYLERMRLRYEEELYDVAGDDEINLVYIIDGIDELNSDTKSILNAIPSDEVLRKLPNEMANHIFVILLSRTKEEESLPAVTKECVSISEQKSGRIFTVDCNNEEYHFLLIKFLKNNYKDFSDTRCEEIVERAQRRFLYIQPYMALGDDILKTDEKLTAYTVAKKYVEELQKMYCGVSRNTFQLICSAIAVFHSISLKEICNLVLFTDVTYDVIGVLNDILPLLTIKRTDGEDVYEYANEEYEKYVQTEMYPSVCEVICRFRISINTWFAKVNRRSSTYGKEWGYYVKKILYVDNLANEIKFEEVSEEYVDTLIQLWAGGDPETLYSKSIKESLHINIINQLGNIKYKELEVLTIEKLKRAGLKYDICERWSGESRTNLSDYEWIDEVNACLSEETNSNKTIRESLSEEEDIDKTIRKSLSEKVDIDKTIRKLEALPEKIQNFSASEYYDVFSHAQLKEETLNEGQLVRYKEAVKLNYNALLSYLKNTYAGTNEDDVYPWLKDERIGRNLSCYTGDKGKGLLEFLDLFETLVKVYAEKNNVEKIKGLTPSYRNFLRHYDENYRQRKIGLYQNFREETFDVSQKMTSWEKTYALYCSVYDNKLIDNIDVIYDISYDRNIPFLNVDHKMCNMKETPNVEKTLNIKEPPNIEETLNIKETPYILNDFINKLLQDLFDETEYEKYYSLNDKMEQGYSRLEFTKKNIMGYGYFSTRKIRNYYNWLSIRYYRSLEEKDRLTSDVLYHRLMEEYDVISKRFLSLLENGDDLLDAMNMFRHIEIIAIEMLYFSKMIPDSIISVKESKAMCIGKLKEFRKKYLSQEDKWSEKLIHRINNQSEWYNSSLPFIVKNTDRTIFEKM